MGRGSDSTSILPRSLVGFLRGGERERTSQVTYLLTSGAPVGQLQRPFHGESAHSESGEPLTAVDVTTAYTGEAEAAPVLLEAHCWP